MTTSTGSVPPPNPLSYTGDVVVPYINKTFDPETRFNTFSVPTVWINTASGNAWMLTRKPNGVADWVPIGGSPGEIDTITTPDSTVVVPTDNNINFLNGTGMNITGSGSNITFTTSGSVPILVTADAGSATPIAGVLQMSGLSTGLTTIAFTNLVGLVGILNVGSGGTGRSSFTPYSVLCSGTGAATVLQEVSGTGTSGQVLTSNGAGALPSWQASGASSRISSVNIQAFTSNGTYTPTSGMAYCIIEVLGGGGAGGGAAATAAGEVSPGAGGAAGEYARGIFSAASIGASKAVTIGAGGTGVSGTTGNTGGTTSVGSLITAIGGGGGGTGTAGTSSYINHSTGGTGGTGGQFRSPGANGGSGELIPTFGNSGAGANSAYGSGGDIVFVLSVVSSAGNAATGYGCGGGGALSSNGSGAQVGGAGSPGFVIITEYIA